MPLLTYRCSNGHEYEAIRSFSTQDPDLGRCPHCGAKPSPVFARGFASRTERQPEDFEPLELEEHLEAKAYYESPEIAAKVLSGEIELKEKGPKWLRPQCPDSLRRGYF